MSCRGRMTTDERVARGLGGAGSKAAGPQLADGRVRSLRAQARTRSAVHCMAVANDRMATEASAEVRVYNGTHRAPLVFRAALR
jgi:hypothetical protein